MNKKIRIICPNCRKKAKFDPAVLTKEKNTFFCSKCHSNFIVSIDEKTKKPISALWGGLAYMSQKSPSNRGIVKAMNLGNYKKEGTVVLIKWDGSGFITFDDFEKMTESEKEKFLRGEPK